MQTKRKSQKKGKNPGEYATISTQAICELPSIKCVVAWKYKSVLPMIGLTK